ncbi:NUDIX hydrolase [Streptomyces sp. NRRL F-5126]|uniref:NUDIX hydrolase n=1 Tax=Streptomyces sp. NRRL F-5126 TaxID=1463857 RepID=UPI0004CC64F5|nr:NUDIX hydrolase [Streptomyces sp. NRRL F-5126]
MDAPPHRSPNASVVVALDSQDHVAILSAPFPRHGGEYIFLPGGRQEQGETPEDCARRELREEAGVTAQSWQHLASHAVTLGDSARVALFLARRLTLGAQELTETEQDFKLSWWPFKDALTAAATDGRFLLPGGPLALLLAEHSLSRFR